MFIPTSTQSLKDAKVNKIFLGLQGEPGTGKTHSAVVTTPNPVVLDFDGGLTAHYGKDIQHWPIHDHAWVSTYANGKFKAKPDGSSANRRDAALHILNTEAVKLEADQTLVVDSWTALQDAHDRETEKVPKLTKSGQVDEYDFWDQKLTYSRTICNALKALRCHVIVLFHESKTRDPVTGELKEKLQPLMQGRFAQELKRFFPDYYRTIVVTSSVIGPTKLKTEGERQYFWQVKGDSVFDAKCTRQYPKEVILIEPDFRKAFGLV